MNPLLTRLGYRPRRNPALRRAPDLMLANALSCHSWLGAADAFRSVEEARVHHADERCCGMAIWGVRAAAPNACDRIPWCTITRRVLSPTARLPSRPK